MQTSARSRSRPGDLTSTSRTRLHVVRTLTASSAWVFSPLRPAPVCVDGGLLYCGRTSCVQRVRLKPRANQRSSVQQQATEQVTSSCNDLTATYTRASPAATTCLNIPEVTTWITCIHSTHEGPTGDAQSIALSRRRTLADTRGCYRSNSVHGFQEKEARFDGPQRR